MIELECSKCGFKKDVNNAFFLKLLGVGLIVIGFLAWKNYFFAGTGFALLICVGIMGCGVLILMFPNIVENILAKKQECPKCKKNDWKELKR